MLVDESKMARAAEAFRLVVIEKKNLREAADVLGVSHETVRRDVAAYGAFLADERRAEDLDERRARAIAELDHIKALALAVYRHAMQDAKGGKKPLAAVAALNTIAGLQTHYRAIGALDAAKEVKS